MPDVIGKLKSLKTLFLDKLDARFGDELAGMRFAIWGLAFKPQTDDMREAPSLVIVEGLLERGAEVAVYDPEAMGEAKKTLGDRFATPHAGTPAALHLRRFALI